MPYYPPTTSGAAAVGPTGAVQYTNGSGAFQGTASLTFSRLGSDAFVTIGDADNDTSGNVTGPNGTATSLNGLPLVFVGGSHFDDGSTPANGGDLTFLATDGVNGGTSGGINFFAGTPDSGSADGGAISFGAGEGGGSGNGGSEFLFSGSADTGLPGDIVLSLGSNTAGKLGNLVVPFIDASDPQASQAIFSDSGVLTFSGSAGAFAASARMNYVLWYPIPGSTTPSMIGSTITTSGLTWSSLTPTSATDAATRQQRARGSTAASAGATGVFTTAGVAAYTGAGPGSYHEFLTGVGTNLTGHQCFVGVSGSATSLAGDPSALTNVIGIGFNAADLSTGNWQFYCNDGSGTATKIDTGIARTTAQLLWVQIYNLPNSVEWNTTVTDLVTGVVYQNLGVNTNTPASGGTVRPYMSVRTGATTTAATIDVMRSFSKWVAG